MRPRSLIILITVCLTACASMAAPTHTPQPPPSATAPAPTITLPSTVVAQGTPTHGPTVTPTTKGECRSIAASGQGATQLKLLQVLIANNPPVWDIVFTRDSQALLTADASPVTRWDLATGQPTQVITAENNANLLAISLDVNRDGSFIATGGGANDHTPRVWDAATNTLYNEMLPHEALVQSVAFNSDGSRLASGDNHNTVRVWDTATGQLQSEFTGNSKELQEAFTRFYWLDETTLVGAGATGVYWWETYTGEAIGKMEKVPDMPYFREIALNQTLNLIASVHQDSTVSLWNLTERSPQGVLPNVTQGALFTVDINAAGTLIAAGGDDGTLWVWDAAAKQLRLECSGPGGALTKVRFSPDGRYLAALSIEDTVWVWGVP